MAYKGTGTGRLGAKNHYFQRTWMLYVMLLLPMAFFVVFKYVPKLNIAIAFKDYNIFRGVWDSPWVGWKWFDQAFHSRDFYNVLRNTLMLNFLDLIVGFPAPIILAIMLNELRSKSYKKITQTMVYLPHFLSWIIISGIAAQLFAPSGGVINIGLGKLGIGPVNFLMNKGMWIVTYIGLGVWKEMGWGTISTWRPLRGSTRKFMRPPKWTARGGSAKSGT
jgi:putative aldouronate transport system permease protein